LIDDEAFALLKAAPVARREKYAWSLFAGLRRGELADLRYGDLHLDAPKPFIKLREEQTKNGKSDVLPLHPYLVKMLNGRTGAADARVVSSVPDMKTVTKDLLRANVELVNKAGRRADYHALRHTFCTNLDRTGCSFTTKRALMRHADSGVTEGYSHARIGELAAAIDRLPSPPIADHQLDQSGDFHRHPLTVIDQPCGVTQPRYTPAVVVDSQLCASIDLNSVHNLSIDKHLGPSTQVD
jgi:integrase